MIVYILIEKENNYVIAVYHDRRLAVAHANRYAADSVDTYIVDRVVRDA